jgi:hypothetical protein
MGHAPEPVKPDPASAGQKMDQHHNLASRLSLSGYPAELRVGRSLANVGWSIEHAAFYRDPIEKKSREIDLLASLGVGPETPTDPLIYHDRFQFRAALSQTDTAALQPTYVVECKQSKHEWVVFLPTSGLPEYAEAEPYFCFSQYSVAAEMLDYVEMIAASTGVDSPADQVDDLVNELPLTPRGKTGHGIAAVAGIENSETGKNRAYRALESCVAAVHFFERRQQGRLAQERMQSFKKSGPLTVSLYLPLIVLEGQLFTMSVGKGGEECLQEAAAAAVHFRGGRGGPGITVPIITTKGLQEFANSALRTWLEIGKFITTSGQIPGEEDSILRTIVNDRWPEPPSTSGSDKEK